MIENSVHADFLMKEIKHRRELKFKVQRSDSDIGKIPYLFNFIGGIFKLFKNTLEYAWNSMNM